MFQTHGIPTVKNEEWKYTSLEPLEKNIFELVKDNKLADRSALFEYCNPQEINIVFVNGIFSADLSNLKNIPSGIIHCPLQEAVAKDLPKIKEFLTKYDPSQKTPFAALNEALNSDGLYIRADQNTACKELIHIVHVTSASRRNSASMPRTLMVLEKSSEATVLESHLSFDDKAVYFANALTDIFLDENATLHYCKSQKESQNAFHIGQTRVWQERNSNFDGFSFMAGGALTRNDLDVVINGEGASANLNALYNMSTTQHVDNHTSVDHRVPNGTSNQLYKGILNQAARGVFNGKIFVRPVAQKTNSYQLNKNLLLGKDCRVDTKPQLEIFADDVKCTHGATIGQLDEDQMFYLQTRCIPSKIARRMLAQGFVDDLFSKIKNESIHHKLDKLVQPSFQALE